MKVEDLMSTDLCTVDPEASLAEASTLMGERGVGSAMVIEDGRLVGIVTERDVVRAMSNAHDAPLRPVAEWMTRSPGSVTRGTSIKDALKVMVDGGFRHLPIVEEGKPVGMVSMRDIAKALAE